MRMIATKSFKYPRGRRNTRALVAGEYFEASPFDGNFLKYACKCAAFAREAVEADPVPLAPDVDDIERLRVIAERLGVEVDKRWGVKRLQGEIDAKRAMARSS